MAGRGSRFVKAGYSAPKWAISVHGKTLFEWSLLSLPLELCSHLVFIALREHESNNELTQFIRNTLSFEGKLDIIFLDSVTQGQAETVLKGADLLDPEKPLLIYNIDTYSTSKSLASALMDEDNDGVLGAFTSSESRFSFAKLDSEGIVIKTAEKEAISNNALNGLYHFRRTDDFTRIARQTINDGRTDKGEYYIAPMYNALIAEGKRYVIDTCDTNWILGTPDELEHFSEHYDG